MIRDARRASVVSATRPTSNKEASKNSPVFQKAAKSLLAVLLLDNRATALGYLVAPSNQKILLASKSDDIFEVLDLVPRKGASTYRSVRKVFLQRITSSAYNAINEEVVRRKSSLHYDQRRPSQYVCGGRR